jgi:hypothetical protein
MIAPSKLQSFIKDAAKEIRSKDAELRMKAARHVRDKVKAKISTKFSDGDASAPGNPPGKVTGNLIKGLKVRGGREAAYVGFVAPAHHALLLEFGCTKTTPRMTLGKGKKRKGVRSTGTMEARPVLFPTFAEESGTVKAILSETRE